MKDWSKWAADFNTPFMRAIVQYRWFYRDKAHGHMQQTAYWATEEDIRGIHPHAQRIPWTRRVIEIPTIPYVLLAKDTQFEPERDF